MSKIFFITALSLMSKIQINLNIVFIKTVMIHMTKDRNICHNSRDQRCAHHHYNNNNLDEKESVTIAMVHISMKQ